MKIDDRHARREEWDQSAAGWEAWFDTIERASKPVSDRLVNMAGVARGNRILDVATGTGEPAITAARLVAPDGHVIATDISPSMIEGARRRASALNVAHVTFHVMAVEEIDFRWEDFDAVLCRWGLMFVPNLDDALHRIREVVRPGGRFAASAWAEPSAVPFLNIEHQALAQYFEKDHFAHGFERLNAFRLSAPGLLESVFSSAGFEEVRCERVAVNYEFASAAEYVRFRQDVSSTAVALAERHPRPIVEAAWRDVASAAEKYAETDGTIRMENTALCAVGVA